MFLIPHNEPLKGTVFQKAVQDIKKELLVVGDPSQLFALITLNLMTPLHQELV